MVTNYNYLDPSVNREQENKTSSFYIQWVKFSAFHAVSVLNQFKDAKVNSQMKMENISLGQNITLCNSVSKDIYKQPLKF